MSWKTLTSGAALGAGSSLPVIVLAYLGERFAGLPFLPFDLFDWLARALPGPVVTVGIDLIVTLILGLRLGPVSATAKLAEQTIAVLIFVSAGAVFGALLAGLAMRRPGRTTRYALALSLVFLAGMTLVEARLGFPPAGAFASLLWMAALLIGWGRLLGWRLTRVEAAMAESEARAVALVRREFLYLAGTGLLALLAGSLGLALRGRQDREPVSAVPDLSGLTPADTSGPAASPPEAVLAARVEPAPGTRPELTSNQEFYRIDINTRAPTVDPASWRLEVSGLVRRPLLLSLDEITALPAVTQAITLSCISNRVGGDLIGTSLWTGVRLKDILDEAGPLRGAREIFIQSVDGFYESVSMQDMFDERTLLVYAMNGAPLPPEHGFPLRIYIPNRYGMKQPKWIARLEVIDHEGPGYWVDRGWSAEAIPHTTSVVDAVAVGEADPETGVVPVGGIAYAGARGISRVEVQVDDGPWVAAQLRAPPLSPLTWVQWRYDWAPQSGRRRFRVRAYDGAGELQIEEPRDPRPDGATGVHTLTVNV